ncbi:MAG: hypothetical protein AAFO69_14880, partial [Bacteroidota bacterium]
PNGPESALESRWSNYTTIPPFHPNRIISSKSFVTNNNLRPASSNRLHQLQESNDNIHRRISTYLPEGIALWYSSESFINQRGSLMVYHIKNGQVISWYATIANRKSWKITQTKGIPLHELQYLLQ